MTSNRKITFLGVAVAAALGVSVSQQAAAAVYALETPTAVLTDQVFPLPATKFFPLSTNYTVGGVNFMYASVTLGGGAKFSGTSNVQLLCMTGGAAPVVVGNPQSANSGAIFFAVNTGITLIGNANSASSYCTVTAPGGITLGGTTDAKSMNFHTWRKVAINTAQTDENRTLISFTKGASVSVTSGALAVGAAANDAVIDVSTGSQKLKGTAPYVTTTLTTALVGMVRYRAVSSNIQTMSAVGSAPFNINANLIEGASPYYKITVSGAPIANTVVTYLSPTSTCAGSLGAGQAPNGQMVTFSGVTGQQMSAGVGVCLIFNGATSISAGALSVAVGRTTTETSKWNYDFSTSNNQLHELLKNGASFKLYNMNLPTAMGGSSAEVSNIRLYNTGTTSGAVRATVFGSDGVQLGAAGGIVVDAATFSPKSAHVVRLADVFSALGISAYTGAQRPWILLEGEVPSMDVQVVTRNLATGVVVNMSPVTRDDSK